MSNRPQDQLVFHRSAKPVVGEFTDRYGQTRIIHRNRSTRLAVARQRTTATIQLNRVAGVLIGQRIKRARLRRGFTLEQLCTRAGIVSATPKSRMWEIENSVRQEGIRLGTLYAIAIALDVEARSLLPTTEEMKRHGRLEFHNVETLDIVQGGQSETVVDRA